VLLDFCILVEAAERADEEKEVREAEKKSRKELAEE